MITPAKAENALFIDLADGKFPIPKMVLRQNIALHPLFIKVAPKILGTEAKLTDLSGEDVNDLVDIVFIGLTRAHKDISKTDLDDMEITVGQLTSALLVVMEQSGLFGNKDSTKGEEAGVPIAEPL